MCRTWVFSLLLIVGCAAASYAGAPDEGAVPEAGTAPADLTRDLTNVDPEKRYQAAVAIGKLGLDGAGAVEALGQALADEDTAVRQAVAWALGQVGPDAAAAVPQLAQALSDADWTVRGRAATALLRLGPAASPAVPELRAGLNDPNELTRSVMAAALWQISGDGTEAVLVLLDLLGSPDARTRRYAVLAVDQLGPLGAPTLPSVLTALTDEDVSVRKAAAGALGKMGVDTAEVRAALGIASGDTDEGVRQQADASLTALGAPPGMPQAGPDVTAYLGPLRAHREALAALQERLQTMQALPSPTTTQQAQQWGDDARALGRDIRSAGQAFHATLHDFVNARTRAGLIEELELARGSMDTFGALTDGYRALIKADLAAYQQSLRTALPRELKGFVVFAARQGAIYKLQRYGVEDILNAESWEEARQRTLARVQQEANTRLDQKTHEIFGISFHDARSARTALRARAHQEVEHQIARLLLKITSNEFIIEFAGGMIVRWLEANLWPRLREAFRNKDNLRERLDRSKETMAEARDRLFALTAQADMEQVQATMRSCEGTMYATRYLVKDLQAAQQAAMLQELEAAAAELKRLMNLTSNRFLLGKRNALEELGGEEEVLRGLLAVHNWLVGQVKVPGVQAPAPGVTAAGVRKPALVQFAGPLFLVHIIETSTMYGPVQKDAWILHPKQPENNVLLTADDTGGYFINKTDRSLGPFTTNYEVGPVLVANRISGVWYGQTLISGDPKYWE